MACKLYCSVDKIDFFMKDMKPGQLAVIVDEKLTEYKDMILQCVTINTLKKYIFLGLDDMLAEGSVNLKVRILQRGELIEVG